MAHMLQWTLAVAVLALPVAAQSIHYPTAGIPRTLDGKPNLASPAPKPGDGKTDFSGLWMPSRPGADFFSFVP